jgi:hypothetical protein
MAISKDLEPLIFKKFSARRQPWWRLEEFGPPNLECVPTPLFSTTNVEFEPVIINNKEIEVVPSATLLGLFISNDFKWNTHIENVCKKVSSRLYFLRQLKQAKIPSKDLLLFYVTCIRPVAEYACEMFHDSLPKYLSDDLEKLQKRACRIILPGHSYENSLNELSLILRLWPTEEKPHKQTF